MGSLITVTPEFLSERAQQSADAGYSKQKWIEFCETLLAEGFELDLSESNSTVSKYIYVSRGRREFKVRFSNHKPAEWREEEDRKDWPDNYFFVGHSHGGITNTSMALIAVRKYFDDEKLSLDK